MRYVEVDSRKNQSATLIEVQELYSSHTITRLVARIKNSIDMLRRIHVGKSDDTK